jgi:hypothetical protein
VIRRKLTRVGIAPLQATAESAMQMVIQSVRITTVLADDPRHVNHDELRVQSGSLFIENSDPSKILEEAGIEIPQTFGVTWQTYLNDDANWGDPEKRWVVDAYKDSAECMILALARLVAFWKWVATHDCGMGLGKDDIHKRPEWTVEHMQALWHATRPKSCDGCVHEGLETSDDVAECNTCDDFAHYEGFK